MTSAGSVARSVKDAPAEIEVREAGRLCVYEEATELWSIRISSAGMFCIRRWIRPESIEGFGRTDSIFSGTREAQLSHARLSTTSDVYVHTNDDDLKKAAEALAGTVQKFLPTTVPTN